MKSLEKNKSVTIAVIVFIFAIVIYKFFFADSTGSVATQSGTAEVVGNDVLSLEAKLRSVSLDTSLFTSQSYQSLVDFTPVIPVTIPGRPDPFAPIGQ